MRIGPAGRRTRALGLAVLGLVDAQAAAAELLTVQRLDGGVGVLRRHLDETEAARLAGLTVGHEADGIDVAVSGEQVAHLVFGGGKGEVADVDRLHNTHSLASDS